MASRASLIQSRSIYVGTANNVAPSDGNLIVTGNVGIGTTSPTTGKLVISQTGGTQLHLVSGDSVGSTDVLLKMTSSMDFRGRGILMTYPSSTGDWFAGVPYTGGAYAIGYSATQPEYKDNAKLLITAAGNVGIGTTSPATKLHVAGTSETSIRVSDSGGAYMELYQQATDSYILASNALRFYNGGSERVRITSTGNVGIGTTSPATALDVVGTVTAYRYQAISSNASLVGYGVGTGLGIFNAGTDTLGFATASTERMRITSAGNVGIGTTAPEQKLHVDGVVLSKGYIATGNYDGPSSVPNTGIFSTNINFADGFGSLIVAARPDAARPIVFATYNGSAMGERMRITSSGNVGIGTTSPGAKLDVVGEIFASSNVQISSVGGAGKYYIRRPSDGSASAFFGYNSADNTDFGVYNGSGGGNVKFWSNNGIFQFNNIASSELMRITAAGNVGIGTTSPVVKLQVDGTITSTGVLTAYTSVPSINIGHNGDSAFIAATSGGGADTPISFSVGNNNEKMRITAAGNVGIGTTGPAYQLTLNKNDNNYLQIRSSDTGAAGIYFGRQNDSVRGSIYYDNNADALYFQTNNLTTNTVITSAGNVGIGTTSPAYKLDVNVASNSDALRVQQAGASKFILNGDGVMTWGASAANGVLTWDNNIAYIGGLTNNALGIWAGGSEKVRITTGGNVGIGTTAPNAKLNVNTDAMGVTVSDASGISLTNTTAATSSVQQMSPTLKWSGQGWKTTATAASQNVSFIAYLTPVPGTAAPSGILNFASSINGGAYANRMSLNAGGGLSISAGFTATTGVFSSTVTNTIANLTTTPTDGVVIVTPTAATSVIPVRISPRLRISGTAWNTGGTPASNTMNWTIDNLPTSGNPPTSALRFSFDINGGGYSPLVSFISNGNVGIGTTAPFSKLTVRTESASHQIFSINRAASDTAALYMGNDASTNAIIAANNSDLRIGKDVSSTFYEYVRVKDGGNVGIGTTSPSTLLNVMTATNAVDVLRLDNSGGNSGSVQGVTHLAINHFGTGTNPSTRITAYQDGVSGWPGGMYFSTRSLNTDSAPVERMRISSAGNVGIGTSSPQYMLDVNGDAQINASGTGPAYAYQPDGAFGLDSLVTSSIENVALGKPDIWLRIHVDGVAFVFPGYQE